MDMALSDVPINCKSAVVGISGGLDSTLALLVTVKAFDMLGMERSQIISVTMPCFGTTDRTYTNACDLTRKLGATLREVDIKEAVNQHFADIGHDKESHDVTYENSQARERTQVLMDIANQCGGLVIGTGDMSELALGWATYNGDHMSMYGVNASVPKTLVRHLVRYYADTCGDEVLSRTLLDVLDTPVSPELLPPKDGEISQKTEDQSSRLETVEKTTTFLYFIARSLHSSTVPTPGGHAQVFPYCPHWLTAHISLTSSENTIFSTGTTAASCTPASLHLLNTSSRSITEYTHCLLSLIHI